MEVRRTNWRINLGCHWYDLGIQSQKQRMNQSLEEDRNKKRVNKLK